ncbi:GNAT family N-acetyltransferase [Rhodoblastus sp. 17X3]|uniref:GNAT family N-acetyltransferase n=1 Tax=Rhodoblastus sp. 17X3 TaxID=3047026 RepID=UPI0024B76D5F|nr:GNAT family N-acetyltransferase [Rhodoblastus sp. 17X3]MDI9848041.1 GNAT family N-acetyltransferase [Rhodoblastus sp. 17X3]
MALFTVETIRDLSRLGELAEEWERLAASLSPHLPFNFPNWALNWWPAYRRDSLAARDELLCYALRDADGGLVAVAPMFVTHRPGYGPLRTRELQFFGADTNVTEWRGLICRPEQAEPVLAALSARLQQDKPADFVQWRGLPAGTCARVFRGDFTPQAIMDLPVFYLDLPDSWDAFKRNLPRNVKESLRKCYNSLARDGHPFTLRVVEAEADVPAALDVFFALHNLRAEARDTSVRHPDVFFAAQSQDFLRAFCADMARRGDLRIFQLVIADKVVATRVGFILGDELYMYFSGYDLEWSRYSVMTTLVAEAIQWAIAHRLRLFNLSTGSDVSKTRWRPARVDFFGGYQILGGAVSRVPLAALLALRNRRSPAKPAVVAAGGEPQQGLAAGSS